ncbi:SRPBCC domain-containing protein [Phyllobacterium sp. 628]|uniref:SRPBCC domain-containing protein n=1 Tax=Phyllobacterium sp. 628 TaxID=2718938 RepID=UPI001662234D|nr:SRPBCC domain-containing protein [Phyllobacterium sp. 628]QND52425.1 SRPBCC domain-containing protein [Phyllobacterium sp. 628]
MVAATSPKGNDRELTITRIVDAPIGLVFKAWSQPEHIVRWWGPKDFTCPSCEMDFRTGGAYRNSIRSPDGEDAWMVGLYQEIIEPSRIAFTFAWEDTDGQCGPQSLVTLTLNEEGNRTKLVFHQAAFATVEDRDSHQNGWTECMERLEDYVELLARNPAPSHAQQPLN